LPRQVYLLLIKPAFAGRTLQTFRHLHACSGCFRLERCRAGLAPAGKRRLCTAHAMRVPSSAARRASATRRGPVVQRFKLVGSTRPIASGRERRCEHQESINRRTFGSGKPSTTPGQQRSFVRTSRTAAPDWQLLFETGGSVAAVIQSGRLLFPLLFPESESWSGSKPDLVDRALLRARWARSLARRQAR